MGYDTSRTTAEGSGQNLQKSMAAFDSPMALVKPATLGQKVSQLRALEAELGPGHLGMRAGPGPQEKAVSQALAKDAGLTTALKVSRP